MSAPTAVSCPQVAPCLTPPTPELPLHHHSTVPRGSLQTLNSSSSSQYELWQPYQLCPCKAALCYHAYMHRPCVSNCCSQADF